jgi:hypothetical protein
MPTQDNPFLSEMFEAWENLTPEELNKKLWQSPQPINEGDLKKEKDNSKFWEFIKEYVK